MGPGQVWFSLFDLVLARNSLRHIEIFISQLLHNEDSKKGFRTIQKTRDFKKIVRAFNTDEETPKTPGHNKMVFKPDHSIGEIDKITRIIWWISVKIVIELTFVLSKG